MSLDTGLRGKKMGALSHRNEAVRQCRPLGLPALSAGPFSRAARAALTFLTLSLD